ncbi:ATP-binding cassette domain-containing protein [Paenibacillus donghaensis]|uniref:ABC transporter domain-containing protein n=1 Tax=Paenibacillus donghaensis TaxID=414771 RepID=A0A2Z2KNR3_9BACL|nr:ATP-binding cassette domain-containing protein [Paenibacillus donghaensis]ASA21761.1 hypothetical protein B9T62_13875 [Paenibacillus donghaensis]
MSFDIKLEQVSVRYRQQTVLHDLSLMIEAGKIYGLIGRNGAGKTTLLSLLASYIEPDAGKVTFDGEEPFEHPVWMSQVAFVHKTNRRVSIFHADNICRSVFNRWSR